MKQKFFNLLLGAILVAGLFSCSDDDEKKVSNSVTIDGEKYTLDNGAFAAYDDEDIHYYDVFLTGKSGDKTAIISLNLIGETDGLLPAGKYTFSESSETLEYFSILVRNAEEEYVSEYDEIKRGNVEVKKSGDTYTITFSLTFTTDEGDVTIKGAYKGAMEVLD